MNDDLIRRGDALAALDWGDIYGRNAQDAVMRVPAATPRPMKDAPRDGTKVLAWWPNDGEWMTTWSRVATSGRVEWHSNWSVVFEDSGCAPTRFLPHPTEGGSDA